MTSRKTSAGNGSLWAKYASPHITILMLFNRRNPSLMGLCFFASFFGSKYINFVFQVFLLDLAVLLLAARWWVRPRWAPGLQASGSEGEAAGRRAAASLCGD